MNVLKLLSDELKVKNWTLEQKVRYLYIRSCQLFSYDERYDFCEYELYDDMDINEILNRKIDLENVLDNRVICTSHADVFNRLIKELLNIECKELGRVHKWNMFDLGNEMIQVDATISSDLARVKMNLTTNGYFPIHKHHNYQYEIKNIDKVIGYIDDEYANFYIEQKRKVLLEKSLDAYGMEQSYIERLYVIKEIFEEYNLKSFTDCEFCISYLIKKFLNSSILMDKASLFDKIDGDINCIKIYYFKLQRHDLYFILQQIENNFYFYEVTNGDVNNYLKSLKGINKQAIYKSLNK